jgi:hypothetical protein
MMVLDEYQLAALAEPVETTRERSKRLRRFMNLGFDLLEAASLAVSPVAIRDAANLIGKGCTPPVAAQILL